MSATRVSVICADAQPVFRDGLVRAIALRPDLELLCALDDGREALDAIVRLSPQVVVLDHDLAHLDGTHVLMAVVRDALPSRLLFLSARLESALVYDTIAAGAVGYLSKKADARQICDAIVSVARGGAELSPAAQQQIIGEIEARWSEDETPLTARERDVLRQIATGRTVNQVACDLGVARATVKTHLEHLYEKLGVSSQAAAVAAAMRRHLID